MTFGVFFLTTLSQYFEDNDVVVQDNQVPGITEEMNSLIKLKIFAEIELFKFTVLTLLNGTLMSKLTLDPQQTWLYSLLSCSQEMD